MLQKEDGPKRAKASSASRVYESQSAFLRLMKVRWGGSGRFIWKELPSWTMIGRWSELRVMRVRHSESKAMWEVAIVMSGEVGSPREGTRVGDSMLRRMRSVFVRDSVIAVPLASASVLVVWEYQAGLWALKSPMMMLLSWKLKRG